MGSTVFGKGVRNSATNIFVRKGEMSTVGENVCNGVINRVGCKNAMNTIFCKSVRDSAINRVWGESAMTAFSNERRHDSAINKNEGKNGAEDVFPMK